MKSNKHKLDEKDLYTMKQICIVLICVLIWLGLSHTIWKTALAFLTMSTEYPWYGEIFYTGRWYVFPLIVLDFIWIFLSMQLDKIKEEKIKIEEKSNKKANKKIENVPHRRIRPKVKTNNSQVTNDLKKTSEKKSINKSKHF